MPSADKNKSLVEIFKDKYNVNLNETNVEIVIASEDDEVELPTIEVKLTNSIKLSV